MPYLLKDANFQEMFADNYFITIIFENCGIQSHTLEMFIDTVYNNEFLTSLFISNNQIQDIEPLSRLVKLQSLSLLNNQITNIDSLQSLVHLKKLYLNNNQITNIDALQSLVHLQHLLLANNQITNINILQYLMHLQILSLDKNNIQDITPLLKLKQLKYLSLYGNPITAEAMTCLREALPDTTILFTHTEVKALYAKTYADWTEESRTLFAKLWDITD